jgi:hypothetical protein
VRRQCELLGLSRASWYYEPVPESPENLRLMRLIDQEYTAHPFYGSRKMTRWLVQEGEARQTHFKCLENQGVLPRKQCSSPPACV